MGSSVEMTGDTDLSIRLDVVDVSDQPSGNYEALYLEAIISFGETHTVHTDRIGPASTFKGPEIGDWRAKWYHIAEITHATLILDTDVCDVQAETDPTYGE